MSILVEPAWLAEHLNDPDLVILDATLPPVGVTPPVDTRKRYEETHVPGAVFFDINDISDHNTSLPHMLPSPEEFEQKMATLGISDQSTIVVYEQTGVYSAPRAWWMLKTMGAKDLHLLNSDLAAWKSAGYPTESGPGCRSASTFHAHYNPAAVTSYDQLRQKLAAHAQIVDARSTGRFTGTAPEPRPGLSSGHMPGAVNVPFTDLASEGKLKSPEEIRTEFARRGIDFNQPITTTCGSGVTAAVLALGLELAGAKTVSLYDGSWAEYASRAESEIEKSI